MCIASLGQDGSHVTQAGLDLQHVQHPVPRHQLAIERRVWCENVGELLELLLLVFQLEPVQEPLVGKHVYPMSWRLAPAEGVASLERFDAR